MSLTKYKRIFEAKHPNLEQSIFDFFANLDPATVDDEKDIHDNLAKQLGMDVHKVETAIYKLLIDYIRNGVRIKNWEGNGKDLTEEDVDPEEFAMGMIVEEEHVKSNPALKSKIILDHLKDNPKYYSQGKKAGLFEELLKKKTEACS
jgi:hypothetical protein